MANKKAGKPPIQPDNGGNGVQERDANVNDNSQAVLEELRENLRFLVAYQPTPRDAGGGGARRTSEIQTTVNDAVRDILGKTLRKNDGRALQAALDHVFKFEIVDGHRRVRYQSPGFTVTTDLGTELSGPQKSLYTFIESAGGELRKRIETMRPLKIVSDSERTEPDRSGWLIELEELIATIRNSINLRPLRIDGAFERLEQYRINAEYSFGYREAQTRRNIQSIDDEQAYTEFLNATHFQNAMGSASKDFKLLQGLPDAAQLEFYDFDETPVLIGTRLALLEDLLSVVSESVEEVYADLEALGVGEVERRVTPLSFIQGPFQEQEMNVGELFDWVLNFTNKAQRILKDGSRSALRILHAEAGRLVELLDNVQWGSDEITIPLEHPRVTISIEALQRHLSGLQDQLAPDQLVEAVKVEAKKQAGGK